MSVSKYELEEELAIQNALASIGCYAFIIAVRIQRIQDQLDAMKEVKE